MDFAFRDELASRALPESQLVSLIERRTSIFRRSVLTLRKALASVGLMLEAGRLGFVNKLEKLMKRFAESF